MKKIEKTGVRNRYGSLHVFDPQEDGTIKIIPASQTIRCGRPEDDRDIIEWVDLPGGPFIEVGEAIGKTISKKFRKFVVGEITINKGVILHPQK